MPSSFARAESLGSVFTCSLCSGCGDGVRLLLDLPPSAMMRLGSTPRRFFLTLWSEGAAGCSAAGVGGGGACAWRVAGMAVERRWDVVWMLAVERGKEEKGETRAAGLC